MANPTCVIEGCEAEQLARGWCSKHYSRWYNHGDPEQLPERLGRARQQPKTCTIEDCDRPAESRGMCSMHYSRWERHGDASVNLRPKGRNSTATKTVPCTEPDCEHPARTKGLCSRHYRRDVYAKRGECSVDDCGATWQARGSV